METLEALIEHYLSLVKAGTAPDITTYCSAHPQYEQPLHELLPLMLDMEALGQTTPPALDALNIPLPFHLTEEYTLLRVIGVGGMGTVFEAMQTSLQRRCVVKLLSQRLPSTDPRHQHFMHEAHIIGLLHHRHIIKVFNAGHAHHFSYYAMEYIDGQSLDTQSFSNYRTLATLAIQIAEAIGYAHQHHVTHRDLKPSNILLDKDGFIHVGDFGLAILNNNEHPLPARVDGGTFRYLAPEAKKASFTPLSDQYAFGITLYELLAAVHHGPSANHSLKWQRTKTGALPSLPNVPKDLVAIAQKCAHPDATLRYTSMEEVILDLNRYLAGEPVIARRQSFIERLAMWMKRKPLAAALSGILLLFVALVFVATIFTIQILLQSLENATRSKEAALQSQAVTTQTLNQLKQSQQETSEALELADKTLEQLLQHINQSPTSRANEHLLSTLLPYYEAIAQKQSLPQKQLSKARIVKGMNALNMGNLTAAEEHFRYEWDHHPTAHVGLLLIHALFAQDKREEASTLAIILINRYGLQPADDATAYSVAQTLMLIPSYQGQATLPLALHLLSQLYQKDPTNPDYRLAIVSLMANVNKDHFDPALLNHLPSLALAELYDIHKTHPENPRYLIAFLEHLAQRLKVETPLSNHEATCLIEGLQLSDKHVQTWAEDARILLVSLHLWEAYLQRLRHEKNKTQARLYDATKHFTIFDAINHHSFFADETRVAFINYLFLAFETARWADNNAQAALIYHHLHQCINTYTGKEKSALEATLQALPPPPKK